MTKQYWVLVEHKGPLKHYFQDFMNRAVVLQTTDPTRAMQFKTQAQAIGFKNTRKLGAKYWAEKITEADA